MAPKSTSPLAWGACVCSECWLPAQQSREVLRNGPGSKPCWLHDKHFSLLFVLLTFHPSTDSRSPPTNLFIDSETPSSLQVHWTPPDGRVQHYKITYSPVSDAAAQQTVSAQLPSRGQPLSHNVTRGALLTPVRFAFRISGLKTKSFLADVLLCKQNSKTLL